MNTHKGFGFLGTIILLVVLCSCSTPNKTMTEKIEDYQGKSVNDFIAGFNLNYKDLVILDEPPGRWSGFKASIDGVEVKVALHPEDSLIRVRLEEASEKAIRQAVIAVITVNEKK